MRGCLPGICPPSSGAYRATSPQGGRLFRRDEVTPPYIAILPQSFLPRPYPINVRARRALRIYYLLFLIYYLNCPSPAKPHPPHISPGTLPRPKNAPPGRFCPAVRKTRDLDLRLPHRTAPLDVACSLRPLRLLRFPVPAAASCSRPRWCTCPQYLGKSQQKNTPQLLARCLLWCTISE